MVWNSVDKVSHFKSLTRLRDFSIKSHEIYETVETLKTRNLHHKYSANLFGKSPKAVTLKKSHNFNPSSQFYCISMHQVFQMSKILCFLSNFSCQKHPKLLNNDF